MRTLKQAPIQKGDRIFVRYDLDVSIKNGKVVDTYRLDSGLETLNYIIDKGAFPVIAGHMGKPEGKVVPSLSTAVLKPYFDSKIGVGKYELLENLRFDPREEQDSIEFARELTQKSNTIIYVNESFATSHRKHTSFIAITKVLQGYAGLHLEKEVETLSQIIKDPKRPLAVLIGGAKLESKMPVISKFLDIADNVMLGGRVGFEWQGEIPEKLLLPSQENKSALDIDSKAIAKYCEVLENSKTFLWAGPMGVFEKEHYEAGTRDIATKAAKLTKEGKLFSVAGGGDTVDALQKFGVMSDFSFVSVGGGAMLEFLANGTLPGIEALL